MECFETIIGLTPEEGCFEGFEESYAESKSGLYLSELQGISLADACGMDVYELMLRARRNAILTVKTDISQESSRAIEAKRSTFNGEIGAAQFSRAERTKGYYGVRLYTSLKGASMRITGLTVLPYTTGDVEVSVYNDFELIATYLVTGCVERRPRRVVFSVPLELGRGNTFFVIEGENAYTGSLMCCGYTWFFDVKRPIFNTTKRHWSSWAMVAGIDGADIDLRNDWQRRSRNMGLVLQASFSCNKDELLCDEEFSDFQNSETDRALAFAMLYKTGEYFLSAVMDSGEINRFTLLSSESLEFNREEYAKKYFQMVSWYVDNIDLEKTDCFQCRGRSKITNRLNGH